MSNCGKNFGVFLPDVFELPHIFVRTKMVTDQYLISKYSVSCTCGWSHGNSRFVYENEAGRIWENHVIVSREEAERRAREIVCKFTGETP